MSDAAPALPAPKPAERRVRQGLIEDWRDAVGILVLLLVAAFFGALIARFWPAADENPADLEARMGAIEARLSQTKPNADSAALRDRVTKLEKRIAVTEAALAAGAIAGNLAGAGIATATGAGAAPGAALSGSAGPEKLVADLSARLTALETKTATAPEDIQAAKDGITQLSTGMTELTTRIDTFAERVGKLENSDLLVLARRASLATAIANLARAAQGSSPFKAEFDVVAAMLPNDPALTEIKPLAGGLPTTGTLTATFGKASDAALDAETLAKSGGGMWSGLWANFMATISARPTGEVPGSSTAGRIARAEVRMKAGDLAAAVKELSAIGGAAKPPLQPWLSQAAARVKLEAALAKLNTEAVAALAAPTTDEPVPQMPTP